MIRISLVLGLIAAVLLGLGIGSAVAAEGREYVFYVMGTVGAFVLLRLWRPKSVASVDATPNTILQEDAVEELASTAPLSGDKAREWLDNFLQQQQSGKN